MMIREAGSARPSWAAVSAWGCLILGALACGEPAQSHTSTLGAPLTAQVEIDGELQRLLGDNRAELEDIVTESEALYARMSDAETEAALSAATLPSLEAMRAELAALSAARLSAAERADVLAELEATSAPEVDVAFKGRLVMRGDVLHVVDDILARDELVQSGASRRTQPVEKANLHTTIAAGATDPFGNPIPGGAPRPDLIAKVEDGQVLFWRPELARLYLVVLPDDVPDAISSAFAQAAFALEAAVPNDCIFINFIVLRQGVYTSLHPLLRALTSVIDVAYSPDACLGRAAGCANSPRLAELTLLPGWTENRMRLGTYVGLETDYDSPRDTDTAPDLNDQNARDVILHELSHILGFEHPSYSELRAEVSELVARVPGSAQGTVPTFMLPTASPLFSSTPSAEDRRVLSHVYAGQCGYRAEYRPLGEVCSLESELACLAHGGACEVALEAGGARVERCRWHNFTDEPSCARYSAGQWQTSSSGSSSVFAGEAGACIVASAGLSSCVSQSFLRTDTDASGACCQQFGTGDEGIFFRAFSDAQTSTYFCSDQKGLGEAVGGSWQFDAESDRAAFTTVNAATGGSAPGWIVSAGDLVQEQELPPNFAFGNERMRTGCVTTRVTSDDDGESGIVFNYRNTLNYWVFDAIPGVRRRIRQVLNGVSNELSVEPWTGPSSWTSIALTVCFGDGVHTFIDDQLSSRVSIDSRVDFVGTGGRMGVWNDGNLGARHAYLLSRSLVEGYGFIQ